MVCDICGKEGARLRHMTRNYGKGERLLVIENVPRGVLTRGSTRRRNPWARDGKSYFFVLSSTSAPLLNLRVGFTE